MERNLDFSALFKTREKNHKNKPTNFVSVAGGTQKRLQSSIIHRKSTRLTTFDTARKLPQCLSPAPKSEAQQKMEHRRQQLEKWKMEKEQKKKELASQKKKPFITGVARNPIKFVPPPPLPKPSTSGRVTRSQTRSTLKPVKPSPKSRSTQSFAPKNATFKPPELKNAVKLPKLAPPSKTKSRKNTITFEPVIHASTNVKQSRNRPALTRQNAVESKSSSRAMTETRNTRSKVKKPSPKKPMQSSSSSSDMEQAKPKNRTPRKSIEPKQLTPKVLAMVSSSDDKSSAESGNKRKTLRSTYAVKDSDSSSNKTSTDMEPSCDEQATMETKLRKSLSKNFCPCPLPSSSSSDRISSDVEFISEQTPAARSRKSLPATSKNQIPKSSSDRISSDVEFINENSPVARSRKSLPATSRNCVLKSSSDRISSDIEFIYVKSPDASARSRKSLSATPKNRVPKSESGSEEKLRSPKSPVKLTLTPEQMEAAKTSPYVTMSRGKDNARKEFTWKMKEGLLDEDASDVDSVEHFRKQLASEVARITDMCQIWDKISGQAALPEFVQEAILAAVGQGRLLVSQKLQQFGSLVERCARPDPRAALVTPADLRGFWDMVFIQVTNVDLRFKKLEELRQRNWVEDAPVVAKKTVKSTAKPAAKKTKPVTGPSKIQQLIAEKRKALKRQEQAQSADIVPPTEGEKSFEAGFFTVRSPVRSPASAPGTPIGKHNLLKAVLSSEAKKASSKCATPLAMLHASRLAKNIELDGVAPLPQTPETNALNSLATPGKSILKSTNIEINKSGRKSTKVVLFQPSDSDDDSFAMFNDYQNSDTLKHSDTFQSALDEDLIKFDETVENQDKENSPSPVIKTRRQSKRLTLNTTATETEPPRRSSRKTRADSNVTEDTKKTPKSSSKKKAKEVDLSNTVEKKTKRSTRKKVLKDNEGNITEEHVATPKRSSRRNKVTTIS